MRSKVSPAAWRRSPPNSKAEPRSADTVIAFEPTHEGRDAFMNAGRWLIAKVAMDRLDVGVSLRDVARLHRQHLPIGAPPTLALEQIDHVHQMLGAMVADVVERVRL